MNEPADPSLVAALRRVLAAAMVRSGGNLDAAVTDMANAVGEALTAVGPRPGVLLSVVPATGGVNYMAVSFPAETADVRVSRMKRLEQHLLLSVPRLVAARVHLEVKDGEKEAARTVDQNGPTADLVR